TAQGELVGVYYNKAMLQQLGLSVPTTFAQFEQALAAAKQAGKVGIQYGDLDKFPGAHTWAAVQERYVPETWMTDFVFGLKYDQTRFDTPEKSENPDVEVAYIDWMTSDEAAQMLVQTGQIPLSTTFTPAGIAQGTLLEQMLATAKKLNQQNGLVPYEDWATPDFYNTLTGGVQDRMGLKVTPEEFASAIQDDHQTFQSSR